MLLFVVGLLLCYRVLAAVMYLFFCRRIACDHDKRGRHGTSTYHMYAWLKVPSRDRSDLLRQESKQDEHGLLAGPCGMLLVSLCCGQARLTRGLGMRDFFGGSSAVHLFGMVRCVVEPQRKTPNVGEGGMFLDKMWHTYICTKGINYARNGKRESESKSTA